MLVAGVALADPLALAAGAQAGTQAAARALALDAGSGLGLPGRARAVGLALCESRAADGECERCDRYGAEAPQELLVHRSHPFEF